MRFAHIKRFDGGTTSFAYTYDRATGLVFYHFAKCCPKDQFSKRKARWISEGRFTKYGPSGHFKVAAGKDIIEQFIKLAEA